MIWHIFRKDVLLLWPYALALSIAQAVGAALVILLGQFHEPRELAIIATFYPFLVFLGIVVLTITAVHQEPLSGVRQDWLMRPIFRSDLLLAKAVFVVLMIHVPIFLIDVAEQLVFRFSLLDSIHAALSRGADLFCALTLPALLLGSVTASLVEALVFGLVVGLSCTVLYLSVFIFAMKPPQLAPGVVWVAMASGEVFIVVGAALTLAFAYARRRVLTTRLMGVLVVLAAVAICGWLPFDQAFAIQQSISGSLVGQKQIELRFAASAHKAAPFTASPEPNNPIDLLVSSSHSAALVRLPVQISGLSGRSVLLADQILVRITGADGAALYQGTGICVRIGNGMGRGCRANALAVFVKPTETDTDVEQQLNLPAAAFAAFKDRPVTLELDYALTLLMPGPTQTIGTIGDERHLIGLGYCGTRIDPDGDEVELRCLSSAAAPSCATALLEDPKDGLHNPALGGCGPNYVPFPQSGLGDVLNPFGLSLPFRDLSGLAHYPIDGTKIQSAHVSLIAYHPTAHFRRRLVIPDIRLADWEVTRSSVHAANAAN